MSTVEILALPRLDEDQVWVLKTLGESIGSDPKRIRNFIDKVRFSPDGHLLWAAATVPGGYGKFSMGEKTAAGNRMPDGAHRASYRLFHGPIPDGFDVDHACRIRRCVHPGHLEAVDHLTNLMRSDGMSARYAARTHCKRGHELTPENMYFYKGKRNACRLCQVVRDNERRDRP